jgi:hypothetical protein
MATSARRFGAVAALMSSAVAASVILALPAHADQAECEDFLASHGMSGPAVGEACGMGAQGDLGGCIQTLAREDVQPEAALAACALAVSG